MTGARRRQRRNKAQETLRELALNPENVLVIHYSCESFYGRETATSPRITSIAVQYYGSGHSNSWSIHKVAEVQGALDLIVERYDDLEKAMLSEFFRFVDRNQRAKWVHWNMRDANYGFAALEHRATVLGVTPAVIPDERKHDLARLLRDLYGSDFIADPRLQRLMEKNKISGKDFLTGAEEAAAFEAHEFLKLHHSTLRKVRIIAAVLDRAVDGTLKTDAKWTDVHGMDVYGVYELITDHWSWKVASVVAVPGSIVGLLVSLFR